MSYLRLTTALAVLFIFAEFSSAQPIQAQRKLGEGVLKVIPPQILPDETRSYLPKIKGFSPENYAPLTSTKTSTVASQSTNITLRRQIGCLEFAFTSLQVKEIEVPQPTGKMQRKTVWYLPYRVRNLGQHYQPQDLNDTTRQKFKQTTVTIPGVEIEDATGFLGEIDDEDILKEIAETVREETVVDVEKMTEDVNNPYTDLKSSGLKKTDATDKFSFIDRFFARFILEGRVQTDLSVGKKPGDGPLTKFTKKAYLDQISPSLIPKIREIEDPNTVFYDTFSIGRIAIPADSDPNSPGVWGVAVWQDLDPRLDYVTIYVTGLSNAFKVFEMPDGSDLYKHKTLQLNFWRPGDIHDEEEDQIRYGIPLTRDPRQQKEICQFYDLPGPVISVEEFKEDTDQKRELFVVEGKIDSNFNLDLQKALDSGSLPAAIHQQFGLHGYDVPTGTPVTKVVDADNLDQPGAKSGIRWEAKVDVDGKTRHFRFTFRPRTWQKIGDRVEIIKRVEHVWIYR